MTKIKLNNDHIEYLDGIREDPQYHFYTNEFWLSFEFMGLTNDQCREVARQYAEHKREKENDQGSHSSKPT